MNIFKGCRKVVSVELFSNVSKIVCTCHEVVGHIKSSPNAHISQEVDRYLHTNQRNRLRDDGL